LPSSLALATLGGLTQIGSLIFFVVPPKVARASKKAISYHNIAGILAGIIALNFDNVNIAKEIWPR
jgi:hypothetical protein